MGVIGLLVSSKKRERERERVGKVTVADGQTDKRTDGRTDME